jgi:hypothetical protein
MKLWLLEPIDDLPWYSDPWEPWYDKAFGFVVRAADEKDAREMAAGFSGDEGSGPWLNAALTRCAELLPDGDSGVIMRHFVSA